MADTDKDLHKLLGLMFQAHPWHGVSAGEEAPDIVNVFIEIVPTDVVKFELHKASGRLMVDRPQRFSSLCPTPYGFIPQTYCGDSVGELCSERVGVDGIRGDGDPMDICVLTEKSLAHGNFIVRARPIGGLRMIDGVDADDKIIAVMVDDIAYGQIEDINDCPKGLVDRLKHYFLSYKQLPNEGYRKVQIPEVYDRAEALSVIRKSFDDYRNKFGVPEDRTRELRRMIAGTGE
jgi:inorganic pyrophosphatase